ncbi:MAG: histidine-type phosphatase [Prevotellaceae bacterium]|nr:histidine-type phosphatase [Prevotellaceae bacterium]
MKRTVLILALSLSAYCLWAQSSREDIKKNVSLSGSNYLAYPAPLKALTPAPKGEKPFYISHYGRHGSRFLIDPNDYDAPILTFKRANEKGKLTELGQQTMAKIEKMKVESNKRLGELTELGAVQHQQIASRMYHRFPEVFKGDVHVDAKSTVVIRCILSMTNELMELTALNPRLQITHDASEHDMYYMNFNDKLTFKNRKNEDTKAFNENYENSNIHPERLMETLFNDAEYVKLYVNERQLMYQLFDLATAVQNSEVRHELSLFELFNEEEIYLNWQRKNIGWFQEYGSNALNGGTQPFSQRNLLKMIIHEADSCMQFERPGATLRFGHETMVLPLTCLLDLNGYGKTMTPDKLEENHWFNYRIFPMGANIQFIFYRKNPSDKDILVKVLLNEEEATLPLTAVSGPYYRWSEVKDYYLNKISNYEETLKETN